MSDAAVRELLARAEEREAGGDLEGALRLYQSAHLAAEPGPLRDELASIIRALKRLLKQPESTAQDPPRDPPRAWLVAAAAATAVLILLLAWLFWPRAGNADLDRRIAAIASQSDLELIELSGADPTKGRATVHWSLSSGIIVNARGLPPADKPYEVWSTHPTGSRRHGALPDDSDGRHIAIFDPPGVTVPPRVEVRTGSVNGRAGETVLSSMPSERPPIYAADFRSASQGWREMRGDGFAALHGAPRYRLGITGKDIYVYSLPPSVSGVSGAGVTASVEIEGDGLAGVIARFSADNARNDHLIHADHPSRPHSSRTPKQMYFCWIARGRTFGCYKIVDYTWTPVLSPRTSEVIVPDALNQIALEAEGTNYRLSINGSLVAQFTEASLTGGTWGLCAYSGPGGFTASFGEFRVIAPKPAT